VRPCECMGRPKITTQPAVPDVVQGTTRPASAKMAAPVQPSVRRRRATTNELASAPVTVAKVPPTDSQYRTTPAPPAAPQPVVTMKGLVGPFACAVEEIGQEIVEGVRHVVHIFVATADHVGHVLHDAAQVVYAAAEESERNALRAAALESAHVVQAQLASAWQAIGGDEAGCTVVPGPLVAALVCEAPVLANVVASTHTPHASTSDVRSVTTLQTNGALSCDDDVLSHHCAIEVRSSGIGEKNDTRTQWPWFFPTTPSFYQPGIPSAMVQSFLGAPFGAPHVVGTPVAASARTATTVSAAALRETLGAHGLSAGRLPRAPQAVSMPQATLTRPRPELESHGGRALSGETLAGSDHAATVFVGRPAGFFAVSCAAVRTGTAVHDNGTARWFATWQHWLEQSADHAQEPHASDESADTSDDGQQRHGDQQPHDDDSSDQQQSGDRN